MKSKQASEAAIRVDFQHILRKKIEDGVAEGRGVAYFWAYWYESLINEDKYRTLSSKSKDYLYGYYSGLLGACSLFLTVYDGNGFVYKDTNIIWS